jgi:hypothetical protein
MLAVKCIEDGQFSFVALIYKARRKWNLVAEVELGVLFDVWLFPNDWIWEVFPVEILKKYNTIHGNLGKLHSFFQFISLKTCLFTPQVSMFLPGVEFGQRHSLFFSNPSCFEFVIEHKIS